jgi:hypothetical protein
LIRQDAAAGPWPASCKRVPDVRGSTAFHEEDGQVTLLHATRHRRFIDETRRGLAAA